MVKPSELEVVDQREQARKAPDWVHGKVISLFNVSDRVNTLGEIYGSWGSGGNHPKGRCTEEVKHGAGKDGSGVWKIHYDITNNGSFAGTFMRLGGMDAQPFKHICFDIKGVEIFSPKIIVELKRLRGTQVDRYILENITADWKRIRLPLSFFSNLDATSDLSEFIFVFDTDVCGELTTGTYYIDNLSFE